MSFDVQLAWPCPHMTMEEVVSLGSDRRSIPCKQPVANGGTVRVMVNDEFFIPQGGLYTSASLYATVSGPYDIVEGEDILTIQAPAGIQTFSLAEFVGNRVTADILVNFFTKNRLTIVDVQSFNGHLVLTDSINAGPDSFVKITGSAAASIGFGAHGVNEYQWSSRGVQLYPSWRLHTRPDEITNRYPKFDYPIQNNPIFKVTYTVPQNRCLRCGGTAIENDYRFDETGQFLIIQDENLLYQAALKILLTDKGSNPFYNWYGTSLRTRIGSKALAGVTTLLNEDIRKALSKFQALQEEQSRYQQVSFKERLYAILSVQVRQHNQDPSTFLIDVVVQNAAADPINLSVVFSVPGVIALMGSNGLMLGQQPSGV